MVWLDAGGMYGGGNPVSDMSMNALLEGYRMVGLNAALLSEREVYPGLQAFLEWIPQVPFPMLTTNILRRRTGEPLGDRFLIEEVQGKGKKQGSAPIRIGILGLNRNPSWPDYSMHAGQFQVNDPVEAAAAAVQELNGKVDLLVAMVYMSRKEARDLAEKVPRLDLILATSGNRTPARVVPGRNLIGDTRIVFGRSLGAEVIEVRLFRDGAPEGRAFKPEVHHVLLVDGYPDDPEGRRLVDETQGKIDEWFRENPFVPATYPKDPPEPAAD